MVTVFEDPQAPGLMFALGGGGLGSRAEPVEWDELVSWDQVREGYSAPVEWWVDGSRGDNRVKVYGFLVGLLQNPLVVSDIFVQQQIVDKAIVDGLVDAVVSGVPVPDLVYRFVVHRVVDKSSYAFTEATKRGSEISAHASQGPFYVPVLRRFASSSQIGVDEYAVLSKTPFRQVCSVLEENRKFSTEDRVMAALL